MLTLFSRLVRRLVDDDVVRRSREMFLMNRIESTPEIITSQRIVPLPRTRASPFAIDCHLHDKASVSTRFLKIGMRIITSPSMSRPESLSLGMSRIFSIYAALHPVPKMIPARVVGST